MTTIIVENQTNTPRKISYRNGENVIKDGDGNYYLISQVGYGVACLFQLESGMEWNRHTGTVDIHWIELNTDNAAEHFGLKKPITRVNAKIDITIE